MQLLIVGGRVEIRVAQMICPSVLDKKTAAFYTFILKTERLQKVDGGLVFRHNTCEYTMKMKVVKGK